MKHHDFYKCSLMLLFFLNAGFISNAQTWTQKADFPSARMDAFCLPLNNKIYVGGGRNLAASTNYTDLWEYDPASDTWTQKNNLPGNTPCIASAYFTYNNKGYVGLGNSGAAVKTSLYEYDPVTDSWLAMASLPSTGRSGSGCFVINDQAYVVGGYSFSTSFNQVWCYDITNNTWTQKAAFPINIADPMAFAIGGKGYICCGDETTGAGVCNRLREYNPATNTWSTKAAFPGTTRQFGVAFVLGSMAYCGLGSDQFVTTTYTDFHSYDQATNSWNAEGNFPAPVFYGAVACSLNSKAYVGGGGLNLSVPTDDFFEYETPLVATAFGETAAEESLSVHPVPSSGEIHLKNLPAEKFTAYRVYDLKGTVVAQGPITPEAVIRPDLANGLYHLSLMSEEKNIHRRLVIQK